MPVIDAHLHIWDLARSDYTWLEGLAPIDRSLSIDDIAPALDRGGVDGVVLVQSDDSDGDTEVMLDAAAADPRVLGVVAYAPLHEGAQATAAALARLSSHPVVGVRTLIHAQSDPEWMRRPGYRDGLAQLAASGLAFDLVGVLPTHLDQAAEIAERLPELRIVLDHLGHPPIGAAELGQWRDLIARVAAYPNVFAKLSGLYATTGALDTWTTDMISPVVAHALEVFGAERLMFGGDWPIAELGGGYDRVIGGLRDVLADLDEARRARIFGGTAADFYRLDADRLATIAHRSHV